MQPGARIVVKNGRELILTLCELTGCGNMWRGIEVEEGGALAMKAYNYLADAQYAVYAHAAAPGEPLPYIAVEGNFFVDNFVGIYMGGPGKVDAFIAGNGFYGAESLLPPFAGQSAAPQGLPEQNGYSLAGIYVDEARTPFSYPQNIFSGLASGIVLLNTSGIVSRSSFDGMNAHMDAYPDYSFAGCGLCRQSETGGMLAAVDNNFSNCDWGMANGGGALAATGNFLSHSRGGIFASNNSAGAITIGGASPVLRNTLEDVEIGILANATDANGFVNIANNDVGTQAEGLGIGIWLAGNRAEAEVRGNTVDVGQAGSGIGLWYSRSVEAADNTVKLLSAAQALAGIHLQGATGCAVKDNTIGGAGTGGEGNNGIHVLSSPDNAYCCNTIDNTRHGVFVQGTSPAPDGLRGNHFGLHEAGLWLDGAMAILGGQIHTENCWANGGRAVYDGVTETFAANFPFFVDPGDAECFLPAEIEPEEQWFFPEDAPNSTPPCTAPQCSLAGFDPESPDAHLIAEGQVEAGVYTDATRWALNRYLYKKAYGLPLESMVMQDFFDTHLHSTVGAFYEIDSGLNALYNANVEDVAAMAAGLDSLGAGLDGLADLDAQLLEASEENWPALLAARGELVGEVTEWADSISALYELVAEERAQLAGLLKAQNDGISVSFIYEQNEKEVNAIRLSYLERGGTGLVAGELHTLQGIAEQCPFSGGRAVFRARAFLAAENKIINWYDDAVACSLEERIQPPTPTQDLAISNQIRLYPNPAKKRAIIEWDKPLQEQGQLVVYNPFGKRVLIAQLENGAIEHQLSLHHLTSGLYFLHIQSHGWEATLKLFVNP